MERIYLDHNATTPVDPRVVDAMTACLREDFGNPSSLHWYGQRARTVLEEARSDVAGLIGATPQEIVFTGSGTEADNLALRGALALARGDRRTLVTSSVEHHAVVHTARALAEESVPVVSVRTSPGGVLDLAHLRSSVDERTCLVAVMAANNETGVLQPVAEAVGIAHERGALVLSDAVQAAGKVPIDVRAVPVDLLALSAHKIYGPKGVGALYVRRGTRLRSLLLGGSQERNRRAGTENLAGIVGFGRAARLAREEMAGEALRVEPLRDALETRLLALPGTLRNGEGPRVPNTTNLSFEGVDAESLLMALDLMGVALSSGAACAAGAVEPSHVLRAMGLAPERVQGSLRFSLGRGTLAEDVQRAAEVVEEAIRRQRAAAGRTLTRVRAGTH